MFFRKKREEPGHHLPLGQRAVPSILRWGIDHPGIVCDLPEIDRAKWRLVVEGEVENPLSLDWGALLSLPQVTSVSDFHCVEGWSVLDQRWEGVRFSVLMAAAKLRPTAKYAWFKCADGYTTSLPLVELKGEDVILAHRLNGEELPQPLGGPLRLMVPQKYAYKSPMWLTGITLTAKDAFGYWERGYYSNTADVWKNDRFRTS